MAHFRSRWDSKPGSDDDLSDDATGARIGGGVAALEAFVIAQRQVLRWLLLFRLHLVHVWVGQAAHVVVGGFYTKRDNHVIECKKT